ncbi:DUF3549 family protein [Glaciecola sp. 1036]|uniref:DUF3549 family protein n=1 Tax=Alteromonadaceae TaxID=72275 RepID=UPI003D01F6E9
MTDVTPSISTISEFLLHAGTEYIIIDVSRGKHVFDPQDFFDIENHKAPFPRARQGKAWLCIMFWNRKLNNEHYIWYLSLPLDERSLLQSAARDQFLQIVVDALGQSLEKTQETDKGLPENPYIFTPNQQLLADCNALLKKRLAFDLSDEAIKAKDYLTKPNGSNWESLSVQNISDAVVMLSEIELSNLLDSDLQTLPSPVLNCLLSSLESIKLNTQQTNALITFFNTQEGNTKALALRALAHGDLETLKALIDDIVRSEEVLDVELLVVIAGRHWHYFNHDDRVLNYFHKVAEASPDFTLFKGVFADLVMLPEVRAYLLRFLKNEQQTPLTKRAIQELIKIS